MKLIIRTNSPTPIYQQIKNAITSQILSGELAEGEALPSIRQLADEIQISVMTIKKAYDELEKEGYLQSRQGKGTFVAPKNMELIWEQKQREIESYMQKIADIANTYSIDRQALEDLFHLFLKE